MKRLLILSLALAGCSTTKQETPVIISNNEQKDAYIDKVEAIVSESASALTAVAPTLPVGIPREIVEGQITRLSGISKASVEKVKEYERIIREKDQKAVEADKAKAAKVDAETDMLWAVVEEQNEKIEIEKQLRAKAETEAKEERKTKIAFQASSASLGLLALGILVTAFSPWKRAGLTVIGLSILSFGGVWWLMS